MPIHLVLYDGVCGLCNRLNRFVLKHDAAGVFRFASLQSSLGQSLLRDQGKDPRMPETLYVLANYGSNATTLLSRSAAVLFVLKTLGGPWRLAAILGILPGPLLDWAYDLIARNRYRIFGRYDSCPVPSPAHKDKFIDV
ncbi:MAG: thiol-disulfide oxidoreductase DCC family protein [Acidobacteriota bacterium]